MGINRTVFLTLFMASAAALGSVWIDPNVAFEAVNRQVHPTQLYRVTHFFLAVNRQLSDPVSFSEGAIHFMGY